MEKKSINDLLQEGWQRRPGAKLSYISPLGKIINKKRDLAPSDQMYGDELFPGKRKVSRVSQPSPTPAYSIRSPTPTTTATTSSSSINSRGESDIELYMCLSILLQIKIICSINVDFKFKTLLSMGKFAQFLA